MSIMTVCAIFRRIHNYYYTKQALKKNNTEKQIRTVAIGKPLETILERVLKLDSFESKKKSIQIGISISSLKK